MNHVLASDQFSREELLKLFEEAKKLQEAVEIPQVMVGKILATIFLEPSTRTRMSFEAAMLRMGGQVISVPNYEASSLNKGETLRDTGRMVSTNADLIAIRTPNKGDSAEFAKHCTVPVINAGDGTGEHPTQNLLDLYTVWREKGTLDGLTFGLMGDCKNSRVLRGLAKMASVFDITFLFIAPEEVKMGDDVKEILNQRSRSFQEAENIDEFIDQLDVLDVNRIRHEYIEDKERARKIGEQFIISKITVEKGKPNLIVLDPLPRINTVLEEVDELPQAKYFQAVENGQYVRMALMKGLLEL